MPEYLAPGVYVEEIPGPRSIEGVSTSTAGFVGPTRFGPTSGEPELLTSYGDFQRIFGDANDLDFGGPPIPNYMALAASGFFREGGKRLYVSRTFLFDSSSLPPASSSGHGPTVDLASADVPSGSLPSSLPTPTTIRARFPGKAGNMIVILTLKVGANALTGHNLTRVHRFDLVWASTGANGGLCIVDRDSAGNWTLVGGTATLGSATAIYPLSVIVEIQRPTTDSLGLPSFTFPELVGVFSFDPRAANAITSVLTARPDTREHYLTVPIAIEGLPLTGQVAGITIAETLFASANISNIPSALPGAKPPSVLQVKVQLDHGTDGQTPRATTYEGDPFFFQDYQNDLVQLPKNGLLAFQSVDDISIVAAPGASTGWQDPPVLAAAHAIDNAVVTHCETMRYRVAVLDTPPKQLPTEALDFRNQRSSNYAALYYPWITIPNPIDGSPLNVPPSGYMAGIYARTDNDRAVFKSPANEVVRSAVDFEHRINKAQQELLNPDGVNCLRFFPGPGFLVWGARTISDDPEWKYLSVRRYFAYLEHSIDRGTQWVVFEVNNEALWASVRRTVEDFLLTEWKSGALLGTDPKEAYFVRCDRSTMTQTDLDNGRLICLIGVAVAKPAEFVIFRIGQMTASATP